MATATISIDDALLARIRESDGGDLSAWIAAACRSLLLSDAARAAREWERTHPAEAAAAHAEEAVRVLAGAVEREISEQAEHTARTRAGASAEPTTVDYLAAYGHVRALLDQAEAQLRKQLGGAQ
ncbi:hypothetical protein GFY24_33540 [Nocardia sp. SYP-A9097]|uniref:hypothetical protein n=1 Tax=Nocardia sp. SYP-A9097 TaxID=2663237 RepID=UPI00129ADCD8|nr:hypothetical protein [Nocardia sp. SYP-A9097]MRH92303.1 hypothetical protein [Nocardia sp. SYP-A9097]